MIARSVSPNPRQAPFCELARTPEAPVLRMGGPWTVTTAGELDRALTQLGWPAQGSLTLDLGGIERLDTTGAWLIQRTQRKLQAQGLETVVAGLSAQHQRLFEQVSCGDQSCAIEPPQRHYLPRMLESIGRGVCDAGRLAWQIAGFLGLLVACLARGLRHPRRLRITSIVHHMEQVGLNAVPIVVLIQFLIGIVLAYMGAQQLVQFGVQVYVVDLLTVGILRELGILLTAVIIAGRSGSAFTAQIGSMMLNEEVDAMRSMGVDPIELLVLPRIVALLLTMPLLVFLAGLAGLLGGGLMTWLVLDIDPPTFVARLREAFELGDFAVGMIKAPFFALVIGLVGCHQGFRVTGSSESLGRLTTESVVQALFSVIILDAVFAVFFSNIGL
ncbi:MAG: MlaE family lipid ABC transporter permease subunit [Desulfobacterales bacterium]